MKTRIIKEILSDYSTRYKPQHKILWWWFDYSWGVYGSVQFETLEACRRYIKEQTSTETVISKVVVG